MSTTPSLQSLMSAPPRAVRARPLATATASIALVAATIACHEAPRPEPATKPVAPKTTQPAQAQPVQAKPAPTKAAVPVRAVPVPPPVAAPAVKSPAKTPPATPAAESIQTPKSPAEQWSQAELEAVSAEIRAQVEELRGLKFKAPVAVKLTDKEGFIGYVLEHEKEEGALATLARDETVAKLLGLIPADMDLEATMLGILREQVGGFYDPATKTFYLMDTCTGGLARIILAHELTHALDDQYFDLQALEKQCGEDTDRIFAFRSVAEGSATQLMTSWTMKNSKQISMADLTAAGQMGAAELAAAPPLLWKPLMGAYQKGEAFLNSARKHLTKEEKADKTTAITRAFTNMPRSSEQVLHPAKYWEEAESDEPMKISIDTDHLPKGWTVVGQDTLGELTIALLTTPLEKRKGLDVSNVLALMSMQYTNKPAEGWGGDRLVLLERGDDRYLELVTAWDTQADADEFAAALGDPASPELIPVMKPDASSQAHPFMPGGTATAARVARAMAADGKTPLVVLRIASFATGDADLDDDSKTLYLPWTVDLAPAKARAGDASAPK